MTFLKRALVKGVASYHFSAQLEIDHVDVDRKTNETSNLRTLCCNCHALKFYVEENFFYSQRHSEETLNKIRKAREKQAARKT